MNYIISEGGTRGIPIEVEKPNGKEYEYLDHFDIAMQAYNAALEEAKKNALPIVPAVPEWDGKVVDADKFQEGICKSDTEFCDECGAPLNTTVLVPIHTNKNLDYHKLNKDFTKTLQEIDSETLNQYSQIPHTDRRGENKELSHGKKCDLAADISSAYSVSYMDAHQIIDNVLASTTPESREESDGDKNWYSIKELMLASMEKGLSPEEWVSLSKALGYSISRNP